MAPRDPDIPAPIVGSADPPAMDRVGGKAHNLARLRAAGARVPPWIVLPVEAFDRLVLRGRPWPTTSEEAAERREEARRLAPAAPLRRAVLGALEAAGLSGRPLAVRSSAVGEDAGNASFAGQFDSVLGVRLDGDGAALWDAVRRVWASAFNAHASAYRAARGRAAEPGHPRMAVVIQQLVDAEVAGVAFSVDPVAGDPGTAVVSAVYGLGEGLVAGTLDADTYRIARPDAAPADAPERVWRTVARKDRAIRPAAAGTRAEPVSSERAAAPALTDEEARRIARRARSLAEAFDAPQDVEWALVDNGGDGRRLFVLQTRPVTTPVDAASDAAVDAASAEQGERRIWDNSNIVESYSGVTTPLTFSFARSVYDEVYRQFCRLLGVGERRIDESRHVFANMLGLIRGRVYYNLLNWYRMLALLPGFSLNRAFMERMMGVAESLDDPPEPAHAVSRPADALRVARMVGRMVREHRRLARSVPAFHVHVREVLEPLRDEDLTDRSAHELVALYRRLEDRLLRRWQVPIVNDFFAMIWFGVLGRLTGRWLPDAPPTLVNDLLCGGGGIESTEPARRIMTLAGRVAESPGLSGLFAEEPDDAALWRRLASDPAHADFLAAIRDYLERFGDRCMNELKLETVTPSDDPSFVVRMVRAYAEQGLVDPDAGRAREASVRDRAEAVVRGTLRAPRRTAYFAVLKRARARVRDRENMRFARTRVFGVVRRLFLGLGHALVRDDRLTAPRDIFHLTTDEVFAYADGTATTTDLRALVALRRAEFEAFEAAPAPPNRFETFGPPDADSAIAPVATTESTDHPSDRLEGLGCCPGVVRAPVRIVRDPASAPDLNGRILVAERTDPGWTLLFPAAAGLIVERGSLLSHSAIVARELGLPCVVGVPDLLDRLEDGERVEMNGATGVIRRLTHADAGPAANRGGSAPADPSDREPPNEE